MNNFLNEDFLLKTNTSKKIFEEIGSLPIIDYHCHLSSKEIAENKRFKNITEIWLKGDHYKWRIMRANGVLEKYITGDVSDYEKFLKWSETIEEAIGNPLYHWTHLELKRYFNYDGLLNKNTADHVWEHCNQVINSEKFSVKDIFEKFSVETLCTTDDPIDDLKYHKIISDDNSFTTKVFPTFRPSNIMNINSENFVGYVKKLEEVSQVNIKNYDDILKALYSRIEYFNNNGCKLSDHSLDPLVYCDYAKNELENIVQSALNGEKISEEQIKKYKTSIFHDLCLKYHELDWVVQLHIGCLRNVNSKMYEVLGADTGYDCMDDRSYAKSLASTLDSLDSISKLPKTILYSLSPVDNDMLTTIAGCFQGDGIKGKIQFGSAWWFNDHIDGMEKQIIALANNGMLSRFVGMLTDSRSFLSYTRHEYFRRILCNLIGKWVEAGEFPEDMDLLVKIVSNISYYNAKEYFKF